VSTAYLVRKIMLRHRYTSAVVALLLIIVLSFTYASLHLHFSAKKAERESRAIVAQWGESVEDHSVFAGSIAFTYFLQLWQEGRTAAAAWAASHLPPNSKERKAAAFLLDSAPLPEKEGDFRTAASGESIWFQEFVIGEHHRGSGNEQDAVQAYRRSYEALRQLSLTEMSRSDQWLARNVAASLYELTDDAPWARGGTRPEPAPQQGAQHVPATEVEN
jgi:hypothetical protein